MAYSAKVMDHFANPRNVGEMQDYSGVGEVGNPKCGDIMRMYIKVENNVITDVSFMTFGCGAADQQSRDGGPGRAAAGEGALLRVGGTGHQGSCGRLLQAPGH